MVYIVFMLMVGIIYLIEWADDRANAQSTKATEETHKKLYALIDEHFGDSPAQARERKAEVDMIIHEHFKDIGRKYSPAAVKQVTTDKERKERFKACSEGRYSAYKVKQFEKAQVLDAIDDAIVDKMIDVERSQSGGNKEYAITKLMERQNISRDEATKRINNFMSTMC